VRFVTHHQVPLARGLQEPLQLLRAAQHIEAGDEMGALGERVAGARGLDLSAGEDVEGEAELLVQLVLPLLYQATGGHDQTVVEVAPDGELLDEKARHDGLAGTRVVRQQEAQRVAGQHVAVNGGDLVWKRRDAGGVDSEIGVEEIGEPDAKGLRNQAQRVAVGVVRPGAPVGDQLQARLIAAIEQLLPYAAGRVLVRDLGSLPAVPFDGNDLRNAKAGARDRLESPGPALQAVPHAVAQGQDVDGGGNRYCARAGGLRVGHRPRGRHDTGARGLTRAPSRICRSIARGSSPATVPGKPAFVQRWGRGHGRGTLANTTWPILAIDARV
jgi:hypothetical protein